MSANFTATAGELSLVSRILAQGDPKKTGHLTGDVAVRIFGGAKLQPTVLGEIWSIADEDNQGQLTSKGVAVAVRLMGWAQKGEKVTPALISRPGPLPTIDGVSDIGRQNTGMSIPRSPPPTTGFPPLTAQDKAKFQNMFHKSGPANGLLSGDRARDIFVKSRLPNDKLGQIWTLADTQDRGSLDATDFTIAMYLIQGAMSGQIATIPATLPPGLYQQISGTASVISHATGNSGTYSPVGSTFSQNRIQPQYTGQSQMLQPNMTGSMSARRGPPVPPHLPARPNVSQIASSAFGTAPKWDITSAEKAESDGFFDTLDTAGRGYIEGEVAVPFMLESNLPGEDLAQVWDLADLNNDGRLNKDGFAVAMHLIKKKLAGGDIPATLPPTLVPPSMRKANGAASPSPFASRPVVSPAAEGLADLLWDDPPPNAAPPVIPQSTGFSSAVAPQTTGFSAPASGFSSPAPRSVSSPVSRQAPQDPFGASPFSSSAARDLMGDDDEETTASPPLQDHSAEIGNAQNQLNSTNRSLQTTKAEREALEQTVANQAGQLAALQTQLSSSKAAYDTETKLLAGLRERLSNQTAEIQKTRESLISAESDLSALRDEKAEVEGSVLRDKEEVRDLHRRMIEFGQQSEALKAEAEKLKKEAKQQRGLLAIARKQLSTKEAEKAKAEKEMQEAAAEHASATKEKEEVDAEIAHVEESINNLAFTTPAPSETLDASPQRALSPDSLAFAASHALPVTPDLTSPGGTKRNNPFERLAMSSGQSTPPRTSSPFLPFSGTTVPSPSNAAAPATAAGVDPFGFDEVFAPEASGADLGPISVEDLLPDAISAETPTSQAPERAVSPTSPTETEDFKTPPTSSSVLPDVVSPARTTTLDAVSSKFPAIDDATLASPSNQTLPGQFPTASEHTDFDAPLKEIELDESDSSDEDEDEVPLAELQKKSNGSARQSLAPSENARPVSSFDDIFGVGEPAAAATSSPAPPAAVSSPFQASSSPFGSADAFGAPAASEPKATSPTAGVSAFDEAMGIIPSSGPSPATAAFSFDSGFDDNFDFGGSPASEPAFPQPPKANGAPVSPLATKSDGFDSLFAKPSTNGNGVHPPAPAAEPQPAPTPSIVAPPAPQAAPAVSPSFDEVFSGFDSATPNLGASLGTPAAAQAPPEPTSFPTSKYSPPKSARPITPTRERSPPPRVSSPTPRPRPSTSSSKDGDKEKPPPTTRHSKLSQIRLPFGKKRKQTQEAPPPPPAQFLTPPAEEPRTGSPAVDDDVEAVKQITAMGFSRTQAVEALEKYSYDVPRALNTLLGQ